MAKSRSVGTKFMIGEKVVGSLASIGGLELTSDTTDVFVAVYTDTCKVAFRD